MENKLDSWKGMTYEELSEYQDKLWKIWEKAHPNPTRKDRDIMLELLDRVDSVWAKANPEAADEVDRNLKAWAEENDRLSYADLEEAGRRVGKRQQSREPKTIVRPVKRTPWSVAVREVTKLNYEGMPYEELSEYQDKLTKAWSATFQEPTQEREWMLEDAWGDVYDLWTKANPEKAAEMNKIWAAMEDVNRTTYADLEG